MVATIVCSHMFRINRYLTEFHLAQSLLRLGFDTYIWCTQEQVDTRVETMFGAAKVISAPPAQVDVIFWVTGFYTAPIPLSWLAKPIFFFLNDWYEESWKEVHYAFENFAELKHKGHQVFFLTPSPAIAKQISELEPKVLSGRVPDSAFLFPEEYCIEKVPAPIVCSFTNLVRERTYQPVWAHLFNTFPSTTFFIGSDEDFAFTRPYNAILRTDIHHYKAMQILYRSAACIAPYKADVSYHPYADAIKYWESVALNTPFIYANAYWDESRIGSFYIKTNDEDELKNFFAEKLKAILAAPHEHKPFKDAKELAQWRVRHWFTRNLAQALVEVLSEWNFPQQLLQFLGTP